MCPRLFLASGWWIVALFNWNGDGMWPQATHMVSLAFFKFPPLFSRPETFILEIVVLGRCSDQFSTSKVWHCRSRPRVL